MESRYGFGTTLSTPYEEALSRVKEALKAEGFGVLTEIDVRQTVREKLGIEREPSLIVGTCNPSLAHRAWEQESEIGLLLPCNVVVRTTCEGCRVEVADPQAMVGIAGNKQLDAIAEEAKQHLQRAVATLGSASTLWAVTLLLHAQTHLAWYEPSEVLLTSSQPTGRARAQSTDRFGNEWAYWGYFLYAIPEYVSWLYTSSLSCRICISSSNSYYLTAMGNRIIAPYCPGALQVNSNCCPISRLPIAVALVIQFSATAWMTLGAAIWYRRIPSMYVVMALALTFGGIVLLTGVWRRTLNGLDRIGLLYASLSVITYMAYLLLGRRVGRDLPSLTATAYGAIVAGFFWLCVQPPWSIPASTWVPGHLLQILLVGTFGMAIPFTLTLAALRRIDATRVGIAGMLELVAAGIIAYFWLGQYLDAWQIGGCVSVMAGVAILQYERAQA